jgi:signal transduction histidine kinase
VRRRILLLVVGMTTLVVLAFAIPLMFLTHSVVGSNADRSIGQQATGIANSLRATTFTPAQVRTLVKRQTNDTGHQVSVRLPDGQVIGSTPADGDDQPGSGFDGSGAGPSQGPAPSGQPGRVRDTPAQVHPSNGGEVAVAFAPTPDGGAYVVRVFLSNSARYQGLTGWYTLIIGASLGLIVLGVVAGELLTRRIARPLIDTARTAQRLSIGDTSARAPTDGPREVADVGVALNRLADRIDQLIMEERETVADLSHRLRTPLTRLRLDAEALTDPDEAERVSTRVSEVERMLTAVIHAARRPQREGRLPSCDASAVVGERVEFWSALTDEQHRASTISLPDEPLAVRASPEDLGAAVDALLENVVAHTSEGTSFSVTLAATSDGARLEIADDGPGIPESAEIRGRSDRGSTGLGLDIARRCAEAAGGSMTIGAAPSGGALVTLVLHSP